MDTILNWIKPGPDRAQTPSARGDVQLVMFNTAGSNWISNMAPLKSTPAGISAVSGIINEPLVLRLPEPILMTILVAAWLCSSG